MSENERASTGAGDTQEGLLSNITETQHPIKKSQSESVSTSPISASQPTVPPSPPKHVSIDELAEAANSFYRMTLVHEISLDSNFKIEPNNAVEEPIHSAVKETMHRAFWDMQRDKLAADPPDYHPALNLLKEVVQSLSNLTMPHNKALQEFISEKMRLEAAEAEFVETGRIHLEAYANPVVEIMAQMCAPVRDNDVAGLKQISDPIDFFRRVFEILELMHMDLANFAIKKMRPFIRRQAGEYEREKFEKFLEMQTKAGIDGLAITRQWLSDAFDKLKKEANILHSKVASPSLHRSISPTPSPPTPNNILREAYLALLTWDKDELPETMVVDGRRIEALSHCLVRTVTLASLILTVCNMVASNHTIFIPQGHASLPQGAMSRLKERVSNDAKGILDGTPARRIASLGDLITMRMLLVVAEWGASLNQTAGGLSDETPTIDPANTGLPETLCDQLVIQVTGVLCGQHAVFSLMFNRAMEFLRKSLSAQPPDPLSLPSGFGALSDTSLEQPNKSLCDRLVAGRTRSDFICCPCDGPTLSENQEAAEDETSEKNRFTSDLARVYDLAVIASRLKPLVTHNRHVFGPYYAEIIHSLIEPQSTSSLS